MPEQDRVTQITPCKNWFYIGPGFYGGEMHVRVVAWGVLASGDVVGLIPEEGDSYRSPQFARLVPIPRATTPGDYIHLNDLTIDQMAQLNIEIT